MRDRTGCVVTLAAMLFVASPAAEAVESRGTGSVARSATESSTPVRDAFGRPVGELAADGSMAPIPLAPPATPEGSPTVAGGGLFHPYVTYPLAQGADALAIGDVTGDGRDDVVAVQASLDLVYVFAQSPGGTLNPPVPYPAPVTYQGPFSGSVDIADMNHDGRLDVLVSLDDAVGVMLQTVNGLLSAPVPYPTVHSSFSNTYKVRAGDFNSDGWSDAVSIDWGTQSEAVDVFLQTPAGTLAAPGVHTVAHGGYDDLEEGDVNGDGRTDVVVMSGQLYANDNLGVLLQNAGGGFGPPAYHDLGGDVLSSGVGIGDVNHDGRKDVVVSYGGNGPSAGIGVFLQGGTGLLAPPFSLTSYDIPQPVEVGDLNLDGRADVVTLHGGWLALGVYLQNGAGALEPEDLYPVPYASHYNRHGLAIGDLNGDFLPDVALADYNFGVTVLYNAGSLPTPVLTSLVRAEAFPDRVELAWEISADPGSTTIVERSDSPNAWREIETVVVDGTHRVRFTDRDVVAGGRYGYRLGYEEGGERAFGGEVWVDLAAVHTLSLRATSPSPKGAHLSVSFTLPEAGAATLALVDLAGRRVASREVGTLGAGEHQVDMAPERPLTPGVYWLRLTQGSGVRIAKVAVTE